MKRREDNQMLKILECANIWFLRFPDFKVENCIEFAVNSHCSLGETCAIERALSIALISANSLQFTAEINLKVENLEDQTFAHAWILSI